MHVFHLCLVFLASGFVGGLIAFVAICCLFVKKDKQYLKDSKFYRFLLKFLTKVVLWALGVKIHVSGLENIPKEGRFLIAGNHVSNYDPIITWHILKKHKIAFVSKRSNLKIPFFGRLARRCCFMEIDRENPRNALKTVDTAVDILKDGKLSVGIYPEGTRSRTGELLPFHNSVFKIAQRADVPIVVCAVWGTEKIVKRTPWKPTDVYLNFIETIPADEVKRMRTVEIGERIKNEIEEVIPKTEAK